MYILILLKINFQEKFIFDIFMKKLNVLILFINKYLKIF